MSTPKTPDATLVSALRLLAKDIQSSEGIAEGVLYEAADRLQELSIVTDVAIEMLDHDNRRDTIEARELLIRARVR